VIAGLDWVSATANPILKFADLDHPITQSNYQITQSPNYPIPCVRLG
jgi:hypothetical protein